MISFVWISNYPLRAGSGGSEAYTIGQVRELQRRGVACRIITIGVDNTESKKDFPDVTFDSLESQEQLNDLDDTVVSVIYPLRIKTKHPSHAIMHCPLSLCDRESTFSVASADGQFLMAPSQFSAKLWADFFDRDVSEVPVVYPFAHKAFGDVARPVRSDNKIKVLFAGRLTPDKGIYTLMAALHFSIIEKDRFTFTATTAGEYAPEGKIVRRLLSSHPDFTLVPARKTPKEMAELMAEYDIVVMPTTGLFWREAFGMVSIEAQHAGCRVVAANSGGLPETDCGLLTLVNPDDPFSLAKGLVRAAELGPPTKEERDVARRKFTVEESVDTLLKALKR